MVTWIWCLGVCCPECVVPVLRSGYTVQVLTGVCDRVCHRVFVQVWYTGQVPEYGDMDVV
jgi:hypothetical protein